MKLSKICEEIEYTLLQGSLETEVRDVIYDSRKIAQIGRASCRERV